MKVSFSTWPYPRRVAHRGGGRHAPENTLAALRFGWSCGYRMFEVDARLCGDGTVILLHDARLERTTDGHGRVDGQAFAALSGLDAGAWHAPFWTGETIPTLERAGRWVVANGGMLNIELKASPGREHETGTAVAAIARSLWRTAPVPPLLSSFSSRALEAARARAPELPRALLFEDLPADWIERCRALECVAVNAHHPAWDAARIAGAHDAMLHALAYTVDDGGRIEELYAMGLDMVFTDEVFTDEVLTGGAFPHEASAREGPVAAGPVGRGSHREEGRPSGAGGQARGRCRPIG